MNQSALDFSIYQRLLQLRNMPGNVDLFWTSFNAVEDCVTAPYSILRIDDIQPFLRCFVPGVESETVRFEQGCGAKIVLVCPK